MHRAAALVLSLLVAGCLSGPNPTEEADQPSGPAYSPPYFDESTGGVEGLVVSDDHAPVPHALVHVASGDHSTQTDEAGRFALGRLEPGPHVLQVNALGFESLAKAIDVAAGEARFVTLQLAPLRILEPYTTTHILNGKTTCTISYRSPVNFLRPSCAIVMTTDKWNLNDRAEAGFVDVLIETTWRPTYSYGNELYQTVGGKPKDAFLAIDEAEGRSPLRIVANRTEWLAWAERHATDFPDSGGTVSISTFAAHNLVREPSPIHLGMVIDQGFTVFSTVAYHAALPESFSAVPDA